MTLREQALEKINSLADAMKNLVIIHNEDEESHPDIRNALNNLGSTDITVITKIDEIEEDGIYLLTAKKQIFTITWDSANLSFGSGIWEVSEGDLTVDYGDGTTETVSPTDPNFTHQYPDNGPHEVKIYGNILRVLGGAFDNCTDHITKVVLPDTMVEITDNMFIYFTKLKEVVFANSITKIGNYAFYDTRLGLINIPSSVTYIGESAFEYVPGDVITIPKTVTHIGKDAFLLADWSDNPDSEPRRYEFYWDTPPVEYSVGGFAATINGVEMIIPKGTTANYVAQGFPSEHLVERE